MPVAIAIPEVVVLVVVGLLLVVLLVGLQLTANGRQARSFAVNLPVVADPTTAALDWVLQQVAQGMRVVDYALSEAATEAANALGDFVVHVVNSAGAIFIVLVHRTADAAASAYALAVEIEDTELPAIRATQGELVSALQADFGAAKAFTLTAVAGAVAPVLGRLGAAESVNAAQQQVIDAYRPMWAQLAAVPGGAAREIVLLTAQVATLTAAVGSLEAQLGQTSSGVSALERQVAAQQAALGRLAVVGVIAGAGAAVAAELVRIAENPCEVCPGLDLNDLEGRVAGLELAGV